MEHCVLPRKHLVLIFVVQTLDPYAIKHGLVYLAQVGDQSLPCPFSPLFLYTYIGCLSLFSQLVHCFCIITKQWVFRFTTSFIYADKGNNNTLVFTQTLLRFSHCLLLPNTITSRTWQQFPNMRTKITKLLLKLSKSPSGIPETL